MQYLKKKLFTFPVVVFATLVFNILFAGPLFADTSTVDIININVPLTCTLTLTENNTHTVSVLPGTHYPTIATSTIKTVCNDAEGFAVYAVGYTDETVGKTVMTASQGVAYDIPTGVYTSGASTSSWSMMLTAVTGTYEPIIVGSADDDEAESNTPDFSTPKAIPSEYTRVVYSYSSTDVGSNPTGSSFTNTFGFYAKPNQIAGSYEGAVKFALVHPSDALEPAAHLYYDANGGTGAPDSQTGTATQTTGTYTYTVSSTRPTKEGYAFRGWATESTATTADYRAGDTLTTNDYTVLYAVWSLPQETTLQNGATVNSKMKSLANNSTMASSVADTKIKAIRRANSLPNDFEADSNNTISASGSDVYIFFDDTNGAGIMYYYTEADIINANTYSSSMFRTLYSLTDISGLEDINTSSVQDMQYMFIGTKNLVDLTPIANWETANVRDMAYMFSVANSINPSALTPGKNGNPNIWNTGNVTDMRYMFNGVFTNDFSGLANWDTHSVAYMSSMFEDTYITNLDFLTPGKNGNPNIWNVSNVYEFSSMFSGCSNLNDISGIANWDTRRAERTNLMFNGTHITDLDDLATGKNDNPNIWNMSRVWDFSYMFNDCSLLSDISGVANWDTSSANNMTGMFQLTAITDLDDLVPGKNNNPNIWNVSNVGDFSFMFSSINSLSDISGIANWDTRSAEKIDGMFFGNAISNLNALTSGKNNNPNIWNVANVTSMVSVFDQCQSLVDISGISNWDTSSVVYMGTMFSTGNLNNISSLSPITNWNLSSIDYCGGGLYGFFGDYSSPIATNFQFNNLAGYVDTSDGSYIASGIQCE